MEKDDLHSLILAWDHHVDDLPGMWSSIKDRRAQLAHIGAHHVVVYKSTPESNRVLVTIGIRHRHSVEHVLRSAAIFDWFDVVGAHDVPAIFAGEVVEKIDVDEDVDQSDVKNGVPGLVVGMFTSVRDVATLMAQFHRERGGFQRAGIRKIWVYRAIDDEHEVMILQEVDSEAAAKQIMGRPEVIAEWMTGAGFGTYPSLFVGTFAHMMSVDDTPRTN